MAGIELKAFWDLESLGCLKADEYYSPSKAEDRHYSRRLRHVRDLLKLQHKTTSKQSVRS
tara:strand:+ start:376 stop:555 length:180 start_codon:yes stop_codon:yes gene_type:complete